MQYIGKILIILGIGIAVAGIILYFAGNKLSWLGHLPGDIRIERENFRFYFPITTMLIISVLVTIIFSVIRNFFN
jgi:hypothetical protein